MKSTELYSTPGREVSWRSHGGKSGLKQKSGSIIARCHSGEDLYKLVPPDVPRSRIQAQRFSLVNRYVVVVKRQSGIIDYYAPLAAVINQYNP